MVNDELVGGLKNAMERGDSLKKAMMTFFNSGYDKKEIEDAAASLIDYESTVKSIPKNVEPSKKIEPIDELNIPSPVQKVSKYGEEEKAIVKPVPQKVIAPVQKQIPQESQTSSKEKAIIVILICLLVFLVGLLLAIFLFKQELIDWISTMVS